MVAKDGEGMPSQRAGGHMDDAWHQLAGDLVHVGDHEQQALAACERGAERASGKSTVQGTCVNADWCIADWCIADWCIEQHVLVNGCMHVREVGAGGIA